MPQLPPHFFFCVCENLIKAMDLFPRKNTHAFMELSDFWCMARGPKVKNLTPVSKCTVRGCTRDILNETVLTTSVPVEFALDGTCTRLQTIYLFTYFGGDKVLKSHF